MLVGANKSSRKRFNPRSNSTRQTTWKSNRLDVQTLSHTRPNSCKHERIQADGLGGSNPRGMSLDSRRSYDLRRSRWNQRQDHKASRVASSHAKSTASEAISGGSPLRASHSRVNGSSPGRAMATIVRRTSSWAVRAAGWADGAICSSIHTFSPMSSDRRELANLLSSPDMPSHSPFCRTSDPKGSDPTRPKSSQHVRFLRKGRRYAP
jgi:hypothetical protein